jgi:hypothetical protein
MDDANTKRPQVTPRPDARAPDDAERPTAPAPGSELTDEEMKRAMEWAASFKKKHDRTFRRLAGK